MVNSGNLVRILWLSRHPMDSDAKAALATHYGNNVEITRIEATFDDLDNQPDGRINGGPLTKVFSLREMVEQFDVLCIILPLDLLLEFSSLLPSNKDLLLYKAHRTVDPSLPGLYHVRFRQWLRIVNLHGKLTPLN